MGAPKCGTTALYEYLKAHPQVFMPAKELYHFGKDFTFRQARSTLGYYLSLFETAKKEQICGDASVWYLYSKTAAQEIQAFNPTAKVIIMLRNPSEMLYSLHSQQLYAGNENIPNFEEALAAETNRRNGEQIPPLIGCPQEGLYYSEVPLYSEQVERYFTHLGRKQVKVIIFDEFVSDTAKVYEKMRIFLDLSSDFTPELKRVNPNKKVRWAWLRNFLKRRPIWLIWAAKVLLPSRGLRQWVQGKLWSMNTSYTERPPMNPLTKQKLVKQFEADVSKLEDLLGKDLSKWKQ